MERIVFKTKEDCCGRIDKGIMKRIYIHSELSCLIPGPSPKALTLDPSPKGEGSGLPSPMGEGLGMRLFAILSIPIFLFTACSSTRNIPAGDKLYTGAKVTIESSTPLKEKKAIRKEAESVLKIQPNSKFLGLPMKLWIYNFAGKPKPKGLGHWIQTNLGEPPVLFSSVSPSQVAGFISSKLYNDGIFKVVTEFKRTDYTKKVSINYIVHAHNPYAISAIIWPTSDDEITKSILSVSTKSLLKPGQNYNLNLLKQEAERIDDQLKNKGFFYFNPQYVLFTADSSIGNNKVSLTVSLKPETPEKAKRIFHIDSVIVFSDYSLRRDSLNKKDTVIYKNAYYISFDKSYSPKTLERAIFVTNGEVYSRIKHNITLNRLMGFGIFKFVNILLYDADSISTGRLNAHIFLTPLPRKSVRADLEVVTKSDNFTGPSLSLNYRNRNALHGAELLSIKLHGSIETQFVGQYTGKYSFEVGPDIDLYIPRFILPFHLVYQSSYYTPKTHLNLSYNYLKRIQYFDLNTFKFTYGYKWKGNIKTEHELNPVSVSYSRLTNTSALFEHLLETNKLLRKSFEQLFIAGLTYTYTLNEQTLVNKRDQFYFKYTSELAGNLLGVIASGGNHNAENPAKIAGSPFAQFARMDADLRNYYRINKKNNLVTRIYGGFGIPYGNSSVLPYTRQFFGGGTNSVRAFRSRSLGPGTYLPPDSLKVNFYLEQGGDIKLEANAEARFDMIGIVKGALFLDAGNTWLLKNNPEVPGGNFNVSHFMNEIAVGTGFGIRFDASFFVLRLDFAFPLLKPWLPLGSRWVANKIALGSSHWRGDNLVLNIAIGYPF